MAYKLFPAEKLFNRVASIFRAKMKVYIETYGCTANEADSSAMREAIIVSGGVIVDSPADADAVIVNTCAVTQHTSRAMLKAIGRHEGRRVIVAGCMAAVQADMLHGCERAEAPGAGPVLSTAGAYGRRQDAVDDVRPDGDRQDRRRLLRPVLVLYRQASPGRPAQSRRPERS